MLTNTIQVDKLNREMNGMASYRNTHIIENRGETNN